jgi:hypothetical protein
VTSTLRMSSFYSSPVSPSSDPCTYVSILRNIKRKAINAGARPQDFDAYLRHILLVVNGPQYRGYTESDKTWHIDLFAWEHFCKLIAAPFLITTDHRSYRAISFSSRLRLPPEREFNYNYRTKSINSPPARYYLHYLTSSSSSGPSPRSEQPVSGSAYTGWCVCAWFDIEGSAT